MAQDNNSETIAVGIDISVPLLGGLGVGTAIQYGGDEDIEGAAYASISITALFLGEWFWMNF